MAFSDDILDRMDGFNLLQRQKFLSLIEVDEKHINLEDTSGNFAYRAAKQLTVKGILNDEEQNQIADEALTVMTEQKRKRGGTPEDPQRKRVAPDAPAGIKCRECPWSTDAVIQMVYQVNGIHSAVITE